MIPGHVPGIGYHPWVKGSSVSWFGFFWDLHAWNRPEEKGPGAQGTVCPFPMTTNATHTVKLDCGPRSPRAWWLACFTASSYFGQWQKFMCLVCVCNWVLFSSWVLRQYMGFKRYKLPNIKWISHRDGDEKQSVGHLLNNAVSCGDRWYLHVKRGEHSVMDRTVPSLCCTPESHVTPCASSISRKKFSVSLSLLHSL